MKTLKMAMSLCFISLVVIAVAYPQDALQQAIDAAKDHFYNGAPTTSWSVYDMEGISVVNTVQSGSIYQIELSYGDPGAYDGVRGVYYINTAGGAAINEWHTEAISGPDAYKDGALSMLGKNLSYTGIHSYYDGDPGEEPAILEGDITADGQDLVIDKLDSRTHMYDAATHEEVYSFEGFLWDPSAVIALYQFNGKETAYNGMTVKVAYDVKEHAIAATHVSVVSGSVEIRYKDAGLANPARRIDNAIQSTYDTSGRALSKTISMPGVSGDTFRIDYDYAKDRMRVYKNGAEILTGIKKRINPSDRQSVNRLTLDLEKGEIGCIFTNGTEFHFDIGTGVEVRDVYRPAGGNLDSPVYKIDYKNKNNGKLERTEYYDARAVALFLPGTVQNNPGHLYIAVNYDSATGATKTLEGYDAQGRLIRKFYYDAGGSIYNPKFTRQDVFMPDYTSSVFSVMTDRQNNKMTVSRDGMAIAFLPDAACTGAGWGFWAGWEDAPDSLIFRIMPEVGQTPAQEYRIDAALGKVTQSIQRSADLTMTITVNYQYDVSGRLSRWDKKTEKAQPAITLPGGIVLQPAVITSKTALSFEYSEDRMQVYQVEEDGTKALVGTYGLSQDPASVINDYEAGYISPSSPAMKLQESPMAEPRSIAAGTGVLVEAAGQPAVPAVEQPAVTGLEQPAPISQPQSDTLQMIALEEQAKAGASSPYNSRQGPPKSSRHGAALWEGTASKDLWNDK